MDNQKIQKSDLEILGGQISTSFGPTQEFVKFLFETLISGAFIPVKS